MIVWAADPAGAAPIWQAWLPTLVGVVVTAVAGVIGMVWVKRLNGPVDDATAVRTVAESRKTDAETNSLEVATARQLIAEIRERMAEQRTEFAHHDAERDARDAERAAQIKELTGQVGDNREQLRAIRRAFAAHAMWDSDAVAALRQHLPGFPDPPPVEFD